MRGLSRGSAASARVIRPPSDLRPREGGARDQTRAQRHVRSGVDPDTEAEPEIKREPSDTSDPGVDPDTEVASNVKPEPTDTPDPGIFEP